MNLNKSTRYALYATLEMALAPDAPVTVAEVAGRYGIPGTALAKVFQQLVRAGLAVGTRGVGGGYRLARAASEITVLQVIDVFQSAPEPGGCLLADASEGCGRPRRCRLARLFDEVDGLARTTFASVTLETLAR